MRIFRTLLITNAAFFVVMLLVQFLIFRNTNTLSGLVPYGLFDLSGGTSPYEIVSGKLWTIVTANFVHLGILHFVFNIYSFVKLGEVVYEFYDEKKLFITYMLGGIGAMLLSVGVDLFLGTNTWTLGASGSIFALAGLLVGGAMKDRRYGVNLPINLSAFLPILLAALALGFIPGMGVNNIAHLGGVVVGFVLGMVLKHDIGEYETPREQNTVKFIYYSLLGVFILSLLLHIMYVITLFI